MNPGNVSRTCEHETNSQDLNEISKITRDSSTHRGLFLEIESQVLGAAVSLHLEREG